MKLESLYNAALTADKLLSDVGLPKFSLLAEFVIHSALGDMESRNKAQRIAEMLHDVHYDIDELPYMTLEPRQPVAWIRKQPDGTLTNEILGVNDVRLTDVQKESGAWHPLFIN